MGERTPDGRGRIKTFTRPQNLTVEDFVAWSGPAGKTGDFGLKHYNMPKKCAVAGHQKHCKIFDTKTRNFIDVAVSLKRDVPNKYYDTAGTLLAKSTKSGLPKSERKTAFDDIAAFEKKHHFPGPNAFNPNKQYVLSTDKAILNYKGDRNGFLDDAKARGMQSPDFYTPNYQ